MCVFACVYPDVFFFNLQIFLLLHCRDLSDNVRPELRRDWFENAWDEWFVAESCDRHRRDWIECRVEGQLWVMNECCHDEHRRQMRTPGKMKTEFSAVKFACLNAKSYILVAADGTVKKSTKGVQHGFSEHLDWDAFVRCLETGELQYSVNKGFVSVGGQVLTYRQLKRALNNLLVKRAVDPDDPTISRLLVLPDNIA